MKKSVPYIIAVFVVLALTLLLVIVARQQPRKINERITLRQRDKIPYGTFAAQKLLQGLFPAATISLDKHEPDYWDNIDKEKSNQAVVLIAKSFNADEAELNKIVRFIKNGNYVFIISKSLSLDANNFFHCSDYSPSFDGYYGIEDDSLQVSLNNPPFISSENHIYPGKRFESFFSAIDTPKTIVLGRTQQQKINFIQLNAGAGSVFIHLAPLAFSNYFILHKNNVQYFQKALSVIPATVNKVVWNEYYLTKPISYDQSEPDLFRVLFQYPSFKWAFITVLLTLLTYVLLEMRRKQRLIPVYQKPVNESLDFVKTIGRLYYDRKDHSNLAKKMSTYFLDHIRSKYKMATQVLDDDFITTLQAKSGYPLAELKPIIRLIEDATKADAAVTEEQLFNFYKHLEHFYQNT